MTRSTDPRTWSVDFLRACHAAYNSGVRTQTAILGNREYDRRRKAARARGRRWPETPAPRPVPPPLGHRRPGDPDWSDEEIRAASRAVRAGASDPELVARARFYETVCGRIRRARARVDPVLAHLHAPSRALLEDVAELAAEGETLAGAALRVGRTERALEQALRRLKAPGRALLDQLRINGEGEGRVRQGTLAGRRAS